MANDPTQPVPLAGTGGLTVAKAGQAAPPLVLDKLIGAPEGTSLTWEALRGKAVVLEFWATWCGPCVGAIPHLNELIDKFKDKPIVFLSVSDEPETIIEKFLKRRPIHGWVGIDRDGSLQADYGVIGVPTMVLINGEGVVAGVAHPNQVDEQLLDGLLAGKPLNLAKGPTARPRLAPGAEQPPAEDETPPLFKILIRPSVSRFGGSLHSENRIELTAAGLQEVLCEAYEVPPHRLDVRLPSSDQRYDVETAVPSDNGAELRVVMRTAVEIALGLDARRETRDTDVDVLKSAGIAASGLTPTAVTSGSNSSQIDPHAVVLVNRELTGLVNQLAERLKAPVLDETGLTGRFDVYLEWTDDTTDGVIRAVEEQLGLRLERGRRPVEFVVVESQNRKTASQPVE